MSFSDAIGNLSNEQLRQIVKLRRAVPLAAFLAANGKARQACALRHRGWMDTVNVYVNSMVIACKHQKMMDPLDMASLMSATESFAIGIIAKEDLTLEEHNLLIECIAEVASPEIIVHEQTWTPEPLPKREEVVRQNYEALKERDLKRGRKSKEEDLDPDGDLIDTGIDPGLAIKALLGKKKEPEPVKAKISAKEALDLALAAIKKKPSESGVQSPDSATEPVRIERGSAGLIQLVGLNTGTIFGGSFETMAQAIVYATKNRLKLGS